MHEFPPCLATPRSIQTSEQFATSIITTIRYRPRLGTAFISLQRPCEGQTFMRHFSKLFLLAALVQRYTINDCRGNLRTLSPVTEHLTDKVVSQGKGSTWTQTQDLMSSLQTAVTDEFPLEDTPKVSPDKNKGHQCPWMFGSPGALIRYTTSLVEYSGAEYKRRSNVLRILAKQRIAYLITVTRSEYRKRKARKRTKVY